MKVDESNFKILDRVSQITATDYEIKWFNAEDIDGYIEEDSIISMLEDLIAEVGRLNEEKDDMERYYKDNWKPIPIKDLYGINDHDFI